MSVDWEFREMTAEEKVEMMDISRSSAAELRRLYLGEWAPEPLPADLAMCNKCRLVAGRYREEYGPECHCDERAMSGHNAPSGVENDGQQSTLRTAPPPRHR